MSEREKIAVRKAGLGDDADIDYETLDAIVADCGGFLRGGGDGGEYAEVWHGDKTYVFSGSGLVAFLYGLKDRHIGDLHEALALCEYIAGSKKASPSVFVRDAIVTRAEALVVRISGDGKIAGGS